LHISNAKSITLIDGSVININQVVREVPQKRLVCKCVWQGQVVYAKFFLGKKAELYAWRDMRGIDALQKANILTPKILKQSSVPEHSAYVVIFEGISPSQSAEAVWSNANEFVRLELAHQLIHVVAQHHEAGLLQTDMYLKNFLIQYDAIYSIDGDGIRSIDKLSIKKAQANLCQLLSKLDVLTIDSQLPSLLETYANARPWRPPLNINKVKKRIEAGRQKATSRFADQKVFRQCTDVNIMSSKNTFIAVSSHYSALVLPTTASQLDECFTQTNIIKDGNTCTVALVSIAPLRVVIKRYNVKNSWHGVSRAFRQTRASASWANAHRLSLLGLATAKPVALIETRTLGVNREAYFLTEYVDAPDTAIFFKQTTDSALRAQAVKHLVELFYRLYLLNISHGDTKASNIKVLSDGKPLLIDLDSMRQHRYDFFAKKAHARDIKRFMQNWKDTPSLYNAFVTAFKVVYVDHAPLQAAQILE